ncbi:MAG: hypothetical protein P8J32_09160 [bacterium]|nr:hypothetical protein [bacterium]
MAGIYWQDMTTTGLQSEAIQVLTILLHTRETDAAKWLEWKELMLSGMKATPEPTINLDGVIRPVFYSLVALYPNVTIHEAVGEPTATHYKEALIFLVDAMRCI